MSGGKNSNNYTLNLHNNSPNLPDRYNPYLTYRVAQDKYLLALYDEAYYSLYTAGLESRGTYYGTITTNCYSFDNNEFKFLITYPELGKSASDQNSRASDGAKFALGKVTLRGNEKLLLQPTSNGNELLLYNTDNHTKINVRCPINIGLSNDSNSHEIQDCHIYGGGPALIIPQHDIMSVFGVDFDQSGNTYYSLNKLPSNIELRAIDVSNGVEKSLQSGLLSNKATTLMQETNCTEISGQQRCDYYLWHGNPFTGVETHKGKIPGDAKISLSRERGKVIYEFIDRQENAIPAGQDFCSRRQTPNCKMEKLNLIPNIRTYLKSTLVSADIGDFDSKSDVNAAGVAAILKNMVIGEVTQELLTTKKTEFVEAVFRTPILDLNQETLVNYVNKEMPKSIARDAELQGAVTAALRTDPGNAKGPKGERGEQGLQGIPGSAGANARQVAETLVGPKASDLGRAVLSATDSSRKKLSDHLATNSDLQEGVADKLKMNPGNAKGPQGDRGEQGLQGIPGSAGANARQVAETLVGPKASDLGRAVLSATDSSRKKLSDHLATNSDLQTGVKDLLKGDTAFQTALKGDRGPAGVNGISPTEDQIAKTLMRDEEFIERVLNTEVDYLIDSTYTPKILADKVTEKLKVDTTFKADVKGDIGPVGLRGPKGDKGDTGLTGSQGPKGDSGKDSGPAEVAKQLVTTKATELGTAVLGVKVGGRSSDKDKSKLSLELAANSDLQQGVANKLKTDPGKAKGPQGLAGQDADPSEIINRLIQNTRFKRSLKGDDGPAGERGKDGTPGAPGLRGPTGPIGPQGLEGQDADPIEVAHRLAHSSRFKRSLKGEDGESGHEGKKGDQGPSGREGFPGLDGKDGRDADPVEVAEKLVTTKAAELGTAILDATGSGGNLATQVANKVNLNQKDLVNKIDVIKLTEGVVNKLTEAEAKRITYATVHAITSNATKKNNPDPNAFEQYEKFAEKLAELLLQKSAINQSSANKLVEDKVSSWALAKYLLIHGGLSKEDKDKAFLLAEEKVSREKLAEYLLEHAGLQNNQNEASATIDHLLSHFFNTRAGAVTAALRSNPGRARGPKGERGEEGAPGDPGLQGPAGKDGINGVPGLRGPTGPIGPQGLEGQDADPIEVAHRLAHSSRFKRSLKGDDGPEGPRGERGVEGTPGVPGLQGSAGKDGVSGLPGEQGLAGQDADLSEIMNRLAHNFRLKRPLKGDDSLSEQPLDSRLNRSAEFQQKLQLRVMQGESYDQDKNEANIELEMEGKSVVIATFLEIGYFFKGDNLYIRNHITGENILIPKNFHFLKVVEDGLDNYKLAFCNNLGNLFFDHKKYDPEYADLSEEHKLIDLKYIKNAANVDLSKYYYHTHTPLFAIKQGELEGQSLEDYRADVYEIAKDKKIGTLIDEFGFFENGKFHHMDHHHGSDQHSEELDVRIQDYEGNFQIGGNTVHPITLYDGHLDLTDYLGYSVNL